MHFELFESYNGFSKIIFLKPFTEKAAIEKYLEKEIFDYSIFIFYNFQYSELSNFSHVLDTTLNNQSWQIFDIVNFVIYKKFKTVKKIVFGSNYVAWSIQKHTKKMGIVYSMFPIVNFFMNTPLYVIGHDE